MRFRMIGAVGLVATVLLSACGEAATPTTAPVATATTSAASTAPTATTGSAAGGTATAPVAAAPTATTIVVGNAGASLLINGAGATFPVPIYTKWFAEYSNVDKDVRFNYQPIGSGAGIQQIQNQTVDFGGSDAPMTDAQLQQAKGGELFHIPTVSGAVVAIYNLPGASKGLKLDGETLANIYLGNITTWDDPAIVSQNSDMAAYLKGDIAVTERSDGSGTTNIFTSYLSAVSPEWKSSVGSGTAVKWPVGLGARGNAGVAGLVQQTPGGFGYVELAYAKQNNLPYAFMKNGAGEFTEPTIEATALAAEGVTIPDDLRVTIVNSSTAGSYPIAGFTYILVYKMQMDPAKGTGLANFLWWATHDGETLAKSLDYAPLSADMTQRVEAKIQALDCGGSPCYK
ncbi:MAG TPA: phosphate ABC transporter substrate-binding protein PstS [Chloroflexia bacterium]|nr:phosphate ABC transporter substrate-binding protein PstS [Chloroflexia bacterium]